MNPANIGRYAIKSEIERGGMATVYLAFDPYVKRDVAIKLLPTNLTHDPTFRARFEREAQTIAALEYPAIVPVYDFGEEQGQPYLVMCYMPGGSLAQKIKTGPLSLPEVSRIFTRLSSALDHVHAQGIIHRDLKPANILFDAYNNAYLSDFGIAHIAAGNSTLTGEGKLVGTPAYISPEQARGDSSIDGRSDIYSLGVILFETLTGRQPFEATTPMGVAVKHITDPIPRLSEVNAGLPYQCQDVIDTAMAKERDQRYQTAASMAHILSLVASKTLKNPPLLEETPTARFLPPLPMRGQPSDKSGAATERAPQPAQGFPTPPPAAQPAQKALPAVQPPSEPRPVSHRRLPVWSWILVGGALLAALCLLVMVVLWLSISGNL
jgi:serine/threonine protein kinase